MAKEVYFAINEKTCCVRFNDDHDNEQQRAFIQGMVAMLADMIAEETDSMDYLRDRFFDAFQAQFEEYEDFKREELDDIFADRGEMTDDEDTEYYVAIA